MSEAEGHWYLDFRLPEAELPLAELRLEDCGGAWVVDGADAEKRVRVRLFLDDRAAAERAAALAAELESLEGLEVGVLAPRDWVAESQAGLPPIRVGRLLVHGSHEPGPWPPHLIRLEIDAGQAFGTGYHETTRACLELILELARRRPLGRVLDVGTGSGILAMAAARLGADQVLGIDNDRPSVPAARENLERNGLAASVGIELGDGPRAFRGGPQRGYDLVVANILAGPLVAMAGALIGATRPGGRLLLSGLLKEQRRSVLRRYLSQACHLEAERGLGDWSALLLRRSR